MKACLHCKIEKPYERFISYIRNGEKRYGICKDCHTKRQQKWVENNKEKWKSITAKCYRQTARNKELKNTYGITEEEYKIQFERQNGKCAICGSLSKRPSGVLDIDHNHTTGKIRDLLCSQCNRGLGFFRDSIDIMNKALAYLKAHL